MWVRAPDRAGNFKKWAGDMLNNSDVSKPRVNSSRAKTRSSRGGKRNRRKKRQLEE